MNTAGNYMKQNISTSYDEGVDYWLKYINEEMSLAYQHNEHRTTNLTVDQLHYVKQFLLLSDGEIFYRNVPCYWNIDIRLIIWVLEGTTICFL